MLEDLVFFRSFLDSASSNLRQIRMMANRFVLITDLKISRPDLSVAKIDRISSKFDLKIEHRISNRIEKIVVLFYINRGDQIHFHNFYIYRVASYLPCKGLAFHLVFSSFVEVVWAFGWKLAWASLMFPSVKIHISPFFNGLDSITVLSITITDLLMFLLLKREFFNAWYTYVACCLLVCYLFLLRIFLCYQ